MKIYPRYQILIFAILLFIGSFFTGAASASSKETLIITGTGSSIDAMQLMAKGFQKKHPGVTVQVLPSIGSTGGIKAVNDDKIDIGVGGDEFIVLAHDINQAQDAAIVSRRLLEEISAPYDLSGREVFMTASIGISLYPDDGADVDDLLKNAEKAMRHTKSEGKNNYHFYSTSMHSFVLELLTLESDLHKALERDELVLYYQPKVDAATRMVKGMEALIRWKHPDKGLIPPQQFIPLAETSDLIIPIGEFVIRTVCEQIKTWQEAGCKTLAPTGWKKRCARGWENEKNTSIL